MNEKNESMKQVNSESQRLLLIDRKALNLSGIVDVESFDETGAVLKTSDGILAVEGENLHVVKLDLSSGAVNIDGKINGIFYSDLGSAKTRGKRLFK